MSNMESLAALAPEVAEARNRFIQSAVLRRDFESAYRDEIVWKAKRQRFDETMKRIPARELQDNRMVLRLIIQQLLDGDNDAFSRAMSEFRAWKEVNPLQPHYSEAEHDLAQVVEAERAAGLYLDYEQPVIEKKMIWFSSRSSKPMMCRLSRCCCWPTTCRELLSWPWMRLVRRL